MINQYRLLGIWTDESRMNELGSIGRLFLCLCVFEAHHRIALISQSSKDIIVLRRKGLPWHSTISVSARISSLHRQLLSIVWIWPEMFNDLLPYNYTTRLQSHFHLLLIHPKIPISGSIGFELDQFSSELVRAASILDAAESIGEADSIHLGWISTRIKVEQSTPTVLRCFPILCLEGTAKPVLTYTKCTIKSIDIFHELVIKKDCMQ